MRNLNIAIRSLFKKGRHNVMKIISLSVGLSVALVMIAKIYFEQSYDTFYPDADRIYRIYENYSCLLYTSLSAVIRFDWFFPESSGTDRYRLQADYQWSDDRRGMQ